MPVEFRMTCGCGFDSKDAIKIAVHFNSCPEVKVLPESFRQWLGAALRAEVERKGKKPA